MKQIIFIIILFYSSISLGEKIDGLFGLKIGEVITKNILTEEQEKLSIGYNFHEWIESINKLNEKDYQIRELNEVQRKIFSINELKENIASLNSGLLLYNINPKVKNEMFDYYNIEISPLTKRITSIIALGDTTEEECEITRKLLIAHFTNKYSASYMEVMYNELVEENLLFKIDNQNYDVIKIMCGVNDPIGIQFTSSYSSEILEEDKSKILEELDKELKKAKDLDTSGM